MRKKLIFFTLSSLALIFMFIFVFDMVKLYAKDEEVKEYEISSNSDFFIDSSLFTHLDDDTPYNQGDVDLTGFNKKLENSKLELYINNKTGAIRVLNKETDYYWCSDVLDIDSYKFTNIIKSRLICSFRLLYRDEKNNVKEIFTNNSEVDLQIYTEDNELINDVYLNKAKIGFKYIISLDENKLTVRLDHESIVEEGTNKINSISLFPYLGASFKDTIPGYFFIPSGSGALIRFSETSPISGRYEASFFGVDANQQNNSEGEVLSMPIFGVNHGKNKNAVFANITSGAAFGSLVYSPPSLDQNFNVLYPVFKLREPYVMTIPGSDKLTVVPEKYYNEDIKIEYTFLSNSDANYVGMAKAYQKYLLDNESIARQESTNKDINLNIEAFGSDYSKGLIFKKHINMTTTRDLLKINEEFDSVGIKNIIYTLRAFTKGGYSGQSVSRYKFNGRLGSLNDLKDLDAYLYYNPIESYNSKKSYPGKVLVNIFNEKSYIYVESNKYKFYSGVKSVLQYTKKALEKYDNIAFDGLGYRLYGDKNNKYDRYEVLNEYSNLLGNKKLMLYKPNSYLFKNTLAYLNMPLYSERSRFVTDSVPFIEIVLKGYMDFYSTFLNFSSNIDLDVLKCIEYGVNPAYLISYKQSYLLSDSLSNNYYATYYGTLSELMKSQYKYINNALKEVNGESIVNKEMVIEGVSVTEYSNGKKIIVNYTNDSYNYEGTLVSSKSYLVK